MRELSLFTGAGGGLLGTKLMGWDHVGYVEFNDYCQRVIASRIRDGFIDEAPIFGDIRTFIRDGYAKAYRGMVDVVTAGFPCQPFSQAGKQEGESDSRNMWPATLRVLSIVRPRFALLENVPGLLTIHRGRYFGRILRGLAKLRYSVKWGVLSAFASGAPHIRKRLWMLCDSNSSGEPTCAEYAKAPRMQGDSANSSCERGVRWWDSEPSVDRVAYGVAHEMDRLRAIGNGQVPDVVRRAWGELA